MGKLIVIEGLDGSGKGTQAQLLFETLEKQGRKVKKISFPVYSSDSSALVRMYLAGQTVTDKELSPSYLRLSQAERERNEKLNSGVKF